VLPNDRAVPIVLDDALADFDDCPLRRCTASAAPGGGAPADPPFHMPQPGSRLFQK
jgi:hypothetical protein